MTSNLSSVNLSGGGGLKQVPGGPNISAINAINEQGKNADAGKNYVVVEGANQATNEFPYIPFARDNYDDVANIKKTWTKDAADGGLGAAPTVVLGKEDADYVLRQRAQIENADFDRWVMQKYDLRDPAQNFLMQQIAPDQFQRRLDLIDYQQNVVSKYARLRLLGAKSLDDLRFEWLVESGKIELPAGPIWDPVQWMNAQYTQDNAGAPPANNAAKSLLNRTRFQKGLFSPLQYPSETQVGWEPNLANPSDPRGIPNLETIGQIFSGTNKGSQPYSRYGTNPIYLPGFANYDADQLGAAA